MAVHHDESKPTFQEQLQVRTCSLIHTHKDIKIILLTLNLFGLPRFFHLSFKKLITSSLIFSGSWSGTRRMENLPITFLGMTVFAPGSLKAP